MLIQERLRLNLVRELKMNLPTKITVFRIITVPILWAILLLDYFDPETKRWIALSVFIIASISDFLDGYIARKYNMVTSLGKFLDPIADKVLVNSLLIYLSATNVIPLICVLLMVSRDTLVDALRMSASSKNVVVSAHWSGKLKTVLQMVAIIVALMPMISTNVIHGFIYFAMIASLLSGIQYFWQLKEIVFKE